MSNNAKYSLYCPECGDTFDPAQVQTFCPKCASPILAKYELDLVQRTLTKEALSSRRRGLWRCQELLPVLDEKFRFTLGEGDTPLLRADRLGGELGLQNLYVKDESGNATGSFKARGLAAAVSKAVELGVREFVIPTAGNAGSALAAYAARSGTKAHVYMPVDTPRPIQAEVKMYGADLHLVDGLISDAAKEAAAEAKTHSWFDVSTFKEPFRVEGKKTMGFEVAEAFGWQLPDVILYPTGGGTGLVGMWKAFAELEALGWIDSKRPRMVSVQSTGCAPVVRAFSEGKERTEAWQNAETIAYGLRVPNAFADRLILRALRESGGTAISVSDAEILDAQKRLGRLEGIFAAPEGAATVAAAEQLHQNKLITTTEKVVLFNTGTGLKYIQ
jgi:threonine synthase